MFKVAFPGATEEEEAREMDWVSETVEFELITRSRDHSIPQGPTVAETLMPFD